MSLAAPVTILPRNREIEELRYLTGYADEAELIERRIEQQREDPAERLEKIGERT